MDLPVDVTQAAEGLPPCVLIGGEAGKVDDLAHRGVHRHDLDGPFEPHQERPDGRSAAQAMGQPRGDVRGMEFARIDFHVDDDLASWRAEIPGRVRSSAEALGGPTTPPGKRVQVHNAGGCETGPGGVATYGKATADKADAFGFKWDRTGRSSKHIGFDWSGPDA